MGWRKMSYSTGGSENNDGRKMHKCESELHWLDMSINLQKSCFLRIGPRAKVVCNNLTCIYGVSLTWVNELRQVFIS